MKIHPVHKATCHCGAVQLELTLPHGLVDPSRCDCSFCRRRGAVVGTVLKGNLKVVRGADALRLYQFGTRNAKHYFCGTCGTYTHHQQRTNPDHFGFNVGCLEGVNPFELAEVPTHDGINHPSDHRED